MISGLTIPIKRKILKKKILNETNQLVNSCLSLVRLRLLNYCLFIYNFSEFPHFPMSMHFI